MSNKVVVVEDSIVNYYKRRYTMIEFALAFCNGNMETALVAAQQLCDTGRLTVERNTSVEQRGFEKTASELDWKASANQHDQFEEQHKDFIAQQKREGRATYQKVEFDYPNLLKAQEHQNMFHKDLRLTGNQSEIRLTPGVVMLVFYDITDAELNAITRIYKADKMIGSVVNAMDSGTQKMTGVVSYAATKVAAPMAQVGVRAGVSILKTIGTTMAKVTGGLISASVQGAKQAAHEIRHDPEVLRAGRELLDAKDSAMRVVGSRSNGSSGGIRITQ